MNCSDKMNCRFELIIPCKYDVVALKDNSDSLEPMFIKTNLKSSRQLAGSVLLDEVNTPILTIYELKQEVRATLGLHGNDNYRYKYIREDTDFAIRKIKLWLFKSGIAFITFNVTINETSKDKVLNVVEFLCNICTQKEKKKEILFERNVDKEKKVVDSFTIKTVLKRLLGLPKMDFLQEYRNDTYNRARCLFYGSYCFESMEERFHFLEMLRLQSKDSMQVAHGVEDMNLYEPRSYLSWAVSPYVLCGVGDLQRCGEANIDFLTNKGGLEQSVFNNYLPIYLNSLSVSLAFDDIQRNYNVYTVTVLKSAPEDIIDKLYLLHNTRIYNLTEWEEPINKLFREYVCKNALAISEKFKLLESTEVLEYMDRIHQDLKESQSRILEVGNKLDDRTGKLVRTVEGIDIRTKNIQEELQELSLFVREYLVQYIKEQKHELRMEIKAGLEKNEVLISETFHNISEYINKQVNSCSDMLLEREEEYLRTVFGVAWDKLEKESKTSLISAGVLWKMCADIKGDFDYSGICISATSALETELKKYFFVGFQKYLEDKYGAPSADKDKWIDTFRNWPEILLSTSERKYRKEWSNYKYKGGEKPCINKAHEFSFSLGTMPFIFGLREDKDLLNVQQVLLRERLNEYLCTFVAVPTDKTAIDVFIEGEEGKSFIDKCERIRTEYRNKAAHDDILSEDQAKGCYHEVIGKIESYKYTSDVTGLLLQLFQHIK